LSASEIHQVRESFGRLRQRLEAHSEYFYERLFARAPGLKSLFREDLEGQGMKFMSALAVILDNLEHPDTIRTRYAELGHLHRALGVKAADFEPMGEALIDTMRNALGDDFTPELELAWRAAYGEFSGMMIHRGRISG